MTTPRVRKRSRSKAGFASSPDVSTLEGGKDHMPLDGIEDVMARYNGGRVPLDVLYPEPPKPEYNPVLDEPQAAPRRAVVPMGEPQNRVLHEAAYIKEARLKTAHRLIMRGANMQQLADTLGLSLSEAFELRSELFRRISREASSIDMPLLVGRSLAFYNEIKASALRGYDTDGITHTDKQRYLVIAKGAEDSQHRLLQVSGFYDDVKLRPAVTVSDDAGDEMADMHRAIKMMMDPNAFMTGIEESLNAEVVFTDKADEDAEIRVL